MPETTLEQLLIANDLAKLNIEQRVQYYNDVCKSLGLNPLTRPFDFITLNGKLQLYAKKDATDQLRRLYHVSVNELTHDHKEALGLYIVTASGVNGQGRGDSSTGAVSIKGLAGDNLANAIMKAETKAKRRLTLSLCGLGILDETEIETSQPDRMATIRDGIITVDPLPASTENVQASVQKLADAESVDGKKERTKPVARKKKESVPDAGKPWAGLAGVNAPKQTNEVFPGLENVGYTPPQDVKAVSNAITPENPITDADVIFPGDPEPTPEVQKTGRLATDDERKAFMARLIKLKDKGFTGIREYLLKESGVQITNDIPVQKMNELVARLEVAESEGKLKELLGGK